LIAEDGRIFEINGATRLDNFNLLSSDQSDALFSLFDIVFDKILYFPKLTLFVSDLD
jgi:hypothetical protein